jgi:hypothetical protein
MVQISIGDDNVPVTSSGNGPIIVNPSSGPPLQVYVGGPTTVIEIGGSLPGADVRLRGDVTGGAGATVIDTRLKTVLSTPGTYSNIKSLTLDEAGRVVQIEEGAVVGGKVQHKIITVVTPGETRWQANGVIENLVGVTIGGISVFSFCTIVDANFVQYDPTTHPAGYETEVGDTVVLLWQ